MGLNAGSKLGPYEIGAPLGAGGMGEVYRARDPRIGRDVAIKVLPDDLAHDDDRLARFRREAQVLGSLNHPHIAAIYGLEESNGITAIVLELVEGPTRAFEGEDASETMALVITKEPDWKRFRRRRLHRFRNCCGVVYNASDPKSCGHR